jgi:capsular polysaccharide biosynthesis protein
MMRRWWWVLLVMMVIGPFLGFLVAAVITYIMPKKYESVAVVQVMPGAGQMAPDGSAEPVHSMPGRYMATELEVIVAQKTLGPAVDRLDLATRWGVDRELAIGMLREAVGTHNRRGTDLIEIRVRHTHPEDARDCAMAVTKAYRDRKAEFEAKRAAGKGRPPRNPVVIHEEPALARAPVSPNGTMNLVLGVVAGLPLGLVLALPLMWLLDRVFGRKGRG